MSKIEEDIEGAGFQAFARALAQSAYGDVLDSGEPYTIFAPTDAAFRKFPRSSRMRLQGDKKLLRAVVGHHIAAGRVLSQRFVGKRIRAVTHSGESVLIVDRDGLYVNMAKLVRPDIIVGTCVLHGIDAVLWPREPAAAAL